MDIKRYQNLFMYIQAVLWDVSRFDDETIKASEISFRLWMSF